MQTQQERLISLVHELHELADQAYRVSGDPIVRAFGGQFDHYSDLLRRSLDSWSSLDEQTLDALKSGSVNYLLDLELIDQLANLLVDEFGHVLEPYEIAYVEHIRDLCGQIRALINIVLNRPHDARLNTKLDSPATRRRLSSSFDNVLCTPVRQMIEGIERLLSAENLNQKQREYLDRALKNSRRLYRVLQTARPLIETQDFRSMAMLSYEYRSPFCGITGFFSLLLEWDNEGL